MPVPPDSLITCHSLADGDGRATPVGFGQIVEIECPYSEVHMFMRTAGTRQLAMATPTGARVLLRGTIDVNGVHTTLGESGFCWERMHTEGD